MGFLLSHKLPLKTTKQWNALKLRNVENHSEFDFWLWFHSCSLIGNIYIWFPCVWSNNAILKGNNSLWNPRVWMRALCLTTWLTFVLLGQVVNLFIVRSCGWLVYCLVAWLTCLMFGQMVNLFIVWSHGQPVYCLVAWLTCLLFGHIINLFIVWWCG